MFYRILKGESPALVLYLNVERETAIIGVRQLKDEGWQAPSFIGCSVNDLEKVVEQVTGPGELCQRLHEKAVASKISYDPLEGAVEKENPLLMWPMIESS